MTVYDVDLYVARHSKNQLMQLTMSVASTQHIIRSVVGPVDPPYLEGYLFPELSNTNVAELRVSDLWYRNPMWLR